MILDGEEVCYKLSCTPSSNAFGLDKCSILKENILLCKSSEPHKVVIFTEPIYKPKGPSGWTEKPGNIYGPHEIVAQIKSHHFFSNG